MAQTSDLAAAFDVSRQSVNTWAQAEDFPAPVFALAGGRVWDVRDVAKWASANKPEYPFSQKRYEAQLAENAANY